MQQEQLFVNPQHPAYINTWISTNYCKKWDIWEGINNINYRKSQYKSNPYRPNGK